MSELKPCPFCGHSDCLLTYHNPKTILHPWYRIECDYCGAKGPGSDQGDHEDEWNRRAQSSTQTPVEVGTTVQAGPLLSDDEIALIVADCSASAHRQDDFSFARAIEQAVLAKRVPQWIPIETAPQDWGVTKFDVWANDARFADCWWGKATYEQGEPGIVYQSDYDCNGPVDSYVRNATHWMPLPPPPGIIGEKGGA